MSLLFLISCLSIKVITIVYAAPKLGHLLHDPLRSGSQNIEPRPMVDESSFSDGYLSENDDPLVSIMRRSDHPSEITGYAGYIFDENLCKQVHGRILCGYNKNKGDNNPFITVDMGDGCRMRGDRIECGYGFDLGKSEIKEAANLRAILVMPTRTPSITLTTETSHRLNSEETTTVEQTIQSDTSSVTDATILPTEFSALSSTMSSTLYLNQLEKVNTDSPLVRSGVSDTTDTTLNTVVTISSSKVINKSIATASSFPTSTIKPENMDTNNPSTIPYRRVLEEIKNATEIVSLNQTATNKSTAHKLKKTISKKRIHAQILRTSKGLNNETSETISILTTSSLNSENQSKVASEIAETNATSIVSNLNIDNQSSKGILEVSETHQISIPTDRDIVKLSSKSVLEVTEISPTPIFSHTSTANKSLEQSTVTEKYKNLRENIDKTSVKTVCVEQKDRIVCYDYKTT